MVNKLKCTLIASVLTSAVAASATAMEAVDDAQLSEVTGQDGLTVVADLHIRIGSVEYGDSTRGTSLALEDIRIDGFGGFMLDVVTGDEFLQSGIAAAESYGIAPADVAVMLAEVGLATGYVLGSDVIQIGGPLLDAEQYPEINKLLPSITVASMTTGNGGNSMGSLAVKGLNPSGSTVWMFGH